MLIAGGDARTPALDPWLAFEHLKHLWDPAEGFGKNGSLLRPLLIPVVFFDLAFQKLGLSPAVTSNLWPAAIAAIQSYFTIRLFRVLVPNCESTSIAFVGLATLLNPLQLLSYHTIFPTTALGIALTPGLIAVALDHARSPRFRTLAEFITLAFLNVASAVNPAIIALQIGLLGITFAASMLTAGKPLRQLLISLQLIAAFLAPGLSLWLPALAFSLKGFQALNSATQSYSQTTLAATSEFSGLWASLRLVGGYLFTNDVGGQPFITAGPAYASNPILIGSTLTLPLLSLAGAFASWRRRSRPIALIAISTLLLLFFIKGTSPPAGAVFEWLFNHVAGMHAFRDPYSKLSWLLALSYAILAGYAIDVAAKYKFHPRLAITVIAIAGLTVSSFPILTGHLFWSHEQTRIPSRYFEAARWFNAGHSGRIIEMPVATNIFDTYRWGYVGSGINHDIINNPLVTPVADFGSDANQALDDSFRSVHYELGDQEAAYILGLLNVRYILQDDSVDVNFFAPTYAAELPRALPHTRLSKRLGSLSIYEIDSKLLNAPIYSPSLLVSGADNLHQLGMLCRMLSNCKDVAAIDEKTASALHTDQIGYISFADKRAKGAWATYHTLPLIRDVTPTSAARNPDKSATTVSDYGNETYADGDQNTRLVTYGSAAPVELNKIAASGTHRMAVLPRPIRLCGRAGQTVWRDVALKSERSGNSNALIRITHQSVAAMPWVGVFEDDSSANTITRAMFAPLRASAAALTFSRIVVLKKSRGDAYVRLASDITSNGGCTTYYALSVDSVGQALTQGSPLSSPVATDGLPPFFGTNATVLARSRDTILRGAASASLPKVTDSTLNVSDLARNWSSPEETAPFQTTFKYGLLLSNATGHGDLPLTLDTLGAHYDVHAYFGHLLPGSVYRLRFKIARSVAGDLHLAVISGAGAFITARDIHAASQPRKVDVSFTLPPNTTSALLYLYDGAQRRYTRDFLSQPTIVMDSPISTTFHILHPSPMPTPQTAIKQLSTTRYDISVRRAPKRFILSMATSKDDAWQLLAPDGVRVRPITTNLYFNGWIISSSRRNYSLRLIYADERWTNVALYATAIDVILLVLITMSIWAIERKSTVE